MNFETVEIVFAIGAVIIALALCVVGGLGLVVWLAGRRRPSRDEE